MGLIRRGGLPDDFFSSKEFGVASLSSRSSAASFGDDDFEGLGSCESISPCSQEGTSGNCEGETVLVDWWRRWLAADSKSRLKEVVRSTRDAIAAVVLS